MILYNSLLYYENNRPFNKVYMRCKYIAGRLNFHRFDYFYGLRFNDDIDKKIKFIIVFFNGNGLKIDKKQPNMILFPFPILSRLLCYTGIYIELYDYNDNRIFDDNIIIDSLGGMTNFCFDNLKTYRGEGYRYKDGCICFDDYSLLI